MVESLEQRTLLAIDSGIGGLAAGHSYSPFDTDRSGEVTPVDALLVVNALNAQQNVAGAGAPSAASFAAQRSHSAAAVDTNGDGQLSPIDALLVINYLNQVADAKVEVRLEVTDLNKTPISQIGVGGEFLLRAFVQDVRADAAQPGVAAAYLDVTYDAARASALGAVVHAADYPNAPSGTLSSGLIDEAGGFQAGLQPLGAGERLLFSVRLHADAAGVVNFMSNPADNLPTNATLVFDPPSTVSAVEIAYGAAMLTIVEDGPAPTISIADVAQNEGNSGTTTMTFTVQLSQPSGQEVMVDFATGPDSTNQFVTFDTNLGAFQVELFSDVAPLTVANFLNYVNRGDYNNSIVHRAVKEFVIQGGGFKYPGGSLPPFPTHIATDPPIQNEHSLSNVRGTLAMSRVGGQVNSATSEWFFNVKDNGGPPSNLDTVDQGFTVFGRVIGAGMIVVDAIANTPTVNAGGAFQSLPVRNFLPGQTSVDASNLVLVNSILVAASNFAATAGSDYQSRIGKLVFLPGETVKTITIEINGDTKFEQDESFAVLLSNPTNATLSQSKATGTIFNDDAPPQSSISGQVYVDLNNNGTPDQGEPPLAGVTIELRGDDGQLLATTTTSAAGEFQFSDLTPGTYSLREQQPAGFDDGLDRAGSAGGSAINPGDAISGIVLAAGVDAVGYTFGERARPLPAVGIADPPAITEGNNGAKTLEFTVTLSAPSEEEIAVDFMTSNGTAQGGSDFQQLSGSFLFLPGQTSRTILIDIKGDLTYELDETFQMTVVPRGNVPVARGTATATITNDDALPTIFIDPVSDFEGDAGTRLFQFLVTVSGPTALPITVDFTTLAGTATAGSDYVARSGTLTFAPDETSKRIEIAVNGDTDVEADETFFVQLTAPTSALLAISQTVGTIQNDDETAREVAISVADARVREGDAGCAWLEFVVTLSRASEHDVSVGYWTSPGTAQAGVDYLPASGRLCFAPGETTKTIKVKVIGDTQFEPDETLCLMLDDPVGATLGRAEALGTIENDDPRCDAAAISGHVYSDRNNDGWMQEWEHGIGGTLVLLQGFTRDREWVVCRTWTDDNGYYEFGELAPGDYKVKAMQPWGYADGRDTPGAGAWLMGNDVICVTICGCERATDNNFGERAWRS